MKGLTIWTPAPGSLLQYKINSIPEGCVKNPQTYLWVVHADLLALSSSTVLLLWKAVLWLFMCLGHTFYTQFML